MAKKNFLDIDGVSYLLEKIKNLFATKDEIKTKLDVSQGTDNVGKVMSVDSTGNLVPTAPYITEVIFHEEDEMIEIVTQNTSDIEAQLAAI